VERYFGEALLEHMLSTSAHLIAPQLRAIVWDRGQNHHFLLST
jgi:hypothetical protein